MVSSLYCLCCVSFAFWGQIRARIRVVLFRSCQAISQRDHDTRFEERVETLSVVFSDDFRARSSFEKYIPPIQSLNNEQKRRAARHSATCCAQRFTIPNYLTEDADALRFTVEPIQEGEIETFNPAHHVDKAQVVIRRIKAVKRLKDEGGWNPLDRVVSLDVDGIQVQ